jgi:hypothetical protein
MQFRGGTFTVLLALPLLAATVGCNDDKVRQLEKQNQELRAKLNDVKKGSNLELQKKCADQAAAKFKESDWSRPERAVYTNHYQQTMNRCFVRIDDTEAWNLSSSTVIKILDAFEGKVYGDYERSMSKEETFWMVCKVTLLSGEVKLCQSQKEFNELVKVYMEQ